MPSCLSSHCSLRIHTKRQAELPQFTTQQSTQTHQETGRTASVHNAAVYINTPGDRPSCLSSYCGLRKHTKRQAELPDFTLRSTQTHQETGRAASVHNAAVYINTPGDRPSCLSSHCGLQKHTRRQAELSQFTLRTIQADHKTGRTVSSHQRSCHCSH